MNVLQLKELGITNIELSGRNTYNEPELFLLLVLIISVW